ncbi:Uncharacterised protein [Mycobacteroides abscessus subsp. abscessus]|nr:Uncharacterised protein [Mycobacteroides abscessus subsp. abscessus]
MLVVDDHFVAPRGNQLSRSRIRDIGKACYTAPLLDRVRQVYAVDRGEQVRVVDHRHARGTERDPDGPGIGVAFCDDVLRQQVFTNKRLTVVLLVDDGDKPVGEDDLERFGIGDEVVENRRQLWIRFVVRRYFDDGLSRRGSGADGHGRRSADPHDSGVGIDCADRDRS